MTETEGPVGRAFRYRTGWHAVGCAVVFYAVFGCIFVSFIPIGHEKVGKGQLPTGVAMMVMGAFGVPTLVMSLWTLAAGVRDTVRPPLVRVTGAALVLPAEARGEPPQGEHGEPLSDRPPHPEAIPLAAIRSVTRDGPPHNQVLEIAHDLSATPLRLAEHMMRPADFNELEAALRAALANAPAA